MNHRSHNSTRIAKLLGVALTTIFVVNTLWSTQSVALECVHYDPVKRTFVRETTGECSSENQRKQRDVQGKSKDVLPSREQDQRNTTAEKIRKLSGKNSKQLELRDTGKSREKLIQRKKSRQKTRSDVKEKVKDTNVKNIEKDERGDK